MGIVTVIKQLEATMLHKFPAAALILGLFAGPAVAQDDGRYAMERTEDGFVRMDRQTGEVSVCREQGEDLVCRLAADDRQAFETDLDALSDRVTALEERLAELSSADLPPEEEIDRAMGIMESFMRRFFGMIQEFQQELGTPEDGTRT
jgi:hypothetical protein